MGLPVRSAWLLLGEPEGPGGVSWSEGPASIFLAEGAAGLSRCSPVQSRPGPSHYLCEPVSPAVNGESAVPEMVGRECINDLLQYLPNTR